LTDQAESLSDPKNAEMIGAHADSYIVDGGKRRIVSITNGQRKVMEFEAYAPKGYGSKKDIDSDLRDRCILISMIRTTKEYQNPTGRLSIWREMRDCLYRLLLTKWKQASAIYEQAGQGLTGRIKELWQPLDTILTLEGVASDEVLRLKAAFLESVKETQDEITDRERVLCEALIKLTANTGITGKDLTTGDIKAEMKLNIQAVKIDLGFTSERSFETWIGANVKRMSLATKRNPKTAGKGNSYTFHYSHIVDILRRFPGYGGVI
jgi:hypothetical protein